MKTIKLRRAAIAGDEFSEIIKKGKQQAIEEGCVVEFRFNGINVKVSEKTNLKHLRRDYFNAHLMEWDTIGDECLPKYYAALNKQIEAKRAERDERLRIYEKRTANEMSTIDEFLDGVLFACQYLVLSSDQPSMAEQIMRESGYQMEDFMKSQKKSQYESRKMMPVIREAFRKHKNLT